MTDLYITIDTEYDFGFTRRNGPDTRRANFDRSIAATTRAGAVGIAYQMDVFDRHGLKAVFFVDPMPALLWGTACIEDVVKPIVARGHDVQLHIHTEWLELAGQANPVGRRTGMNIKDFSFEDQCTLLEYARRTLESAGAPGPVAFRAGNYGANDDTLRALAEIGIAYDTSFSPGFAASPCNISLDGSTLAPVTHCSIVEVPIGCIGGRGGGLRHAQVTAISAEEIIAALIHSRQTDAGQFTLVSHSFELLSRDRARINKVVKRRFETLCGRLARLQGVETATYGTRPPEVPAVHRDAPPLPFSIMRTGWRMAEQAMGNALYGAG